MKKADKITCENGGGFVQEFKVFWMSCKEPEIHYCNWSSGKYPNPQSRSIKLSDLEIPEDAMVGIEVHAILGNTMRIDKEDCIIYFPNSENGALYKTTGTTLNYSIKLMN